ncbi:hypothetical protein BH11CYA1_BH11CYA1_11880 [soil metagenome]
MQELSSQAERPSLHEKPAEHSKQMHFGNFTLNDIHALTNLTNLTNTHLLKLNQELPTLLLEDKLTNLDHHIVAAGDTLSQIAADHLGAASQQEIYNYVNQIGALNHIEQHDEIVSGDYLIFPDLNIATEGSIFHPSQHKPHVALANLLQNAASGLQHGHVAVIYPAHPGQAITSMQEQLGPVTAASAAAAADLPGASSPAKVEESTISDFLSGLGNVVNAVVDHCVEEVTEHPGQCIQEVASAIVIGTAVVLAAPEIAAALTAAEIVVTGAELLTAFGAFGTASTVTELAFNMGDWYEAAAVVANPDEHTGQEIHLAQGEMAEVGHFIVGQAQGFLGGLHTPHITPHSSTRKGFDEEENEDEEKEKEQARKAA